MAVFKPVQKRQVPCCPVCGEPLEGMGKPIPPKGRGKCPWGGVYFDYELEQKGGTGSVAKDKDGNLQDVKSYKITSENIEEHA